MRQLLRLSDIGLRPAVLFPLLGCIDNSVAPAHSAARVPVRDDTGDSAWSPDDACPASEPPDRTVGRSGACTLPTPDWNLTVKWYWNAPNHWQREAHVGRFEDSNGDGAVTVLDDMQVLLNDSAWGRTDNPMFVLSGTGTVLRADNALAGWGMYATVGDADPSRPGMEYLMAGLSSDAAVFAAAAGGPGTLLYLVPLDVDRSAAGGQPFLADLDADGSPDVLGSAGVNSALDGRLLFTIPASDVGGVRAVAADLDLDGLPEIVAELNWEPAILDNAGRLSAVCPILDTLETVAGNMLFAIGNLDDDPEGEFAVARPGVLAICEADGAIGHAISTGSANATNVGIGELTGDDIPELIVDESRSDEAIPVSVAAYDRNLSLLWRHTMSAGDGKAPFAVADLDGDGLHEILVHRASGGLLILSHDGTELASIAGSATGGQDGPIIADIDGDGLAEILVAGEQPTLTVYTNDAGGWPVVGASDPWPSTDHFPGDRNLDGTLPDPGDVHWLIPGHNVWQGLTPGRAALPDVGVELTDACSDDCRSTVITAYVSNHGDADDPMPITIELSNIDDGTILDTAVLDGIPVGGSLAVEFRVASDAVGTGVRVVATGAWAECGDVPNDAVLTDLPCR